MLTHHQLCAFGALQWAPGLGEGEAWETGAALHLAPPHGQTRSFLRPERVDQVWIWRATWMVPFGLVCFLLRPTRRPSPKKMSQHPKTPLEIPKNSIYRHFKRLDVGEIVLKRPQYFAYEWPVLAFINTEVFIVIQGTKIPPNSNVIHYTWPRMMIGLGSSCSSSSSWSDWAWKKASGSLSTSLMGMTVVFVRPAFQGIVFDSDEHL